eukprot:GDKJ01021326.1.p2 GENE.GDKJ01021326.1~~GDKJ01021326.1.p2  ORF type:complete len:243 (-),score=-5.03 GDKJ01021326.1:1287-2015(-)
MKYSLIVVFFLLLISCNSVKIKENEYKVTSSSTEIGSIGQSRSSSLNNEFTTHAFPQLENKIRVNVHVIPFTKKANKLYLKKGKYNQNQSEIVYVDSLKTKPELVEITILDIEGYVKEVNSNTNRNIISYLKDTKKAKIVSSIITTLSADNIAKIRQADTYYLVNSQENKYTLALYNTNKKAETIDLQSGVVLGYKLVSCCWSITDRGKWYLADLVEENTSCHGTTTPRVKDKKTTKSLYKM